MTNQCNLLVRELNITYNRIQACKVLEKWSKMAYKGVKEEEISSIAKEKLLDCQKISEESISLIKSSMHCTQFHLYVCFDQKKIAQALACVWVPKTGKKMYLSRIVTCPWNISPLNASQKEYATKGAGTILLTQIQDQAKKAKMDLTLNSLPGAKKLLFKTWIFSRPR